MPRLRFRLRTLMAIVAVVGIALGVGSWAIRLWRLSVYYRLLATIHDRAAQAVTRGTYLGPNGALFHVEWPAPDKNYHLRLKEKYERAARHPWIPVPPDPPEPE